jgi:hypothetical protein
MPKGKPKAYKVTGEAAVLGYAKGDTFTDLLSEEQESRLIAAGSIEPVSAAADGGTSKATAPAAGPDKTKE